MGSRFRPGTLPRFFVFSKEKGVNMNLFLKKMMASVLVMTLAVTAVALPVAADWSKDSSGRWIYLTSGQTRATGWLKVGGTWYYFDGNGIMQTGWQKIGGTWYYFRDWGGMVTGWQKIDGTWYYFRDWGGMVTGWQKIDGVWYYFNGGGSMCKGWVQSGGKWYYLSGTGAMRTGWLLDRGSWYYLNSSGAMITGWSQIGGKTYYFNGNGVMAVGTVTIGGESYEFDSSGAYIGNKVPGDSVAEQVLALVNQMRAAEGLPTLSLSTSLCKAADIRAKERAAMGSIAHYRPDGSEWYTVLQEVGVSGAGAAENLAYGVSTPEAVMKAWMESPSHKSAILNPSYLYMGVGNYTQNGVTYWAQLFSSSSTAKN